MPKIEIKTDGIQGFVMVDGVQLTGVVGYSVRHGVGDIPHVTVEFASHDLTIEAGVADVTCINDDSRKFATVVAALPRSGH